MRLSEFGTNTTVILGIPLTLLYIVSSAPFFTHTEPQIQVVETIPEVPAILKKIAECESENRQFDTDGSVLRGKQNNQDVGMYQINEHYHLETSKKMGMDIYTLKGNTEYALYLYNTQGTKPWNWSKPCWNK